MPSLKEKKYKLLYKFGDYNFNLPVQYKIVHWVPIIFPPCRNIYLFSKDPENTFNYEFREKLIKYLDYKVTSVYDTCGYNPLLYIIEDRNLSFISNKLNELKDSGIDLTPNVFSYCMPDSVVKRHGVLFDNKSATIENSLRLKQENLYRNPYLIDLLEYMIYFKREEYIGDEFQDDFHENSLKRSKIELEESINSIIEDLKNLSNDNDRLLKELVLFHNKNKEYFLQYIDEIRTSLKDEDKLKSYIYFTPIIITPILAFVFLRLSNNKEEHAKHKSYILDKLAFNQKIIDLYRLNCNKDDYVLKVWADSIKDLDRFINENFYKKNIYTSTKVVLKPWKKEGWVSSRISQYFEPKDESLSTLDYQILSIIDNHAERLCSLSEDDQILSIFNLLRMNSVENAKKYLIKSHLENLKKSKAIEKYSIKLEKKQWIKTLIFIKAASGKKEKISSIIKNELLGISEISFARKFYHLTGEYDFIVPVDFLGLAYLRAKVGSFSDKAGELINNIRIFTEISEEYIGGPEEDLELDESQQALIISLLPNSENYSYAEFDNSPRTVFFENYCKKINSGKSCDSIDFNSIKSFILPTVEIKSSMMIHMFIRFRIKDKKGFNSALKKYESANTQIKLGIILRVFRPLHDTNICFCIITVKSFQLLNSFLREFDDYSISILPNLIFSQSFFESKVPYELMCRPCTSHQTLQCRACKQYITPRSNSNIHTFDLGVPKIDKVKISINQIRKIPEKEFDLVSKRIIQQITNGSRIIVFPELTISRDALVKIIESIPERLSNVKVDNNIIIIPGSQIIESNTLKHEKINMIVIDKNKHIHQFTENYRNYKSEYDGKLDYGNNGVWRYINTGCGNFAILNCYDFIAQKHEIMNKFSEKQNRLDIVFVIAKNFNPTGMKQYNSGADTFASQSNIFIAIANNAGNKFGGSSLWSPIINKDKNSLVQMISSDTEDEIHYEIDLIELDKSRAINTSYLSKSEEEAIKKKYFWKIASSRAFGPIHSEEWAHKGEQGATH